jgi:hypothetical protein
MPPVTLGSARVASVDFRASCAKVLVHKFDGKCTLQLGDPSGTPGIAFRAKVILEKAPGAAGKVDWGELDLVQNIDFHFRRTPPVTPDSQHKLSHECCGSGGAWQLDANAARPLTRPRKCTIGANPLQGSDSPGIFLEQGTHSFEVVDAQASFRTYLVWRVGKAEAVLGRIDWTWEAHAIGLGGPGGTCQSATIKDSWALEPGAPVVPPKAGPAAAAVLGAAAGTPVMAPAADPTKWVLC